MHQISFGGRGSLQRSPRPSSCIKGCLLLREERGEKGKGWGWWRALGKGGKGWGEGGEERGGRSGEGKGEYASLALGGGRHC